MMGFTFDNTLSYYFLVITLVAYLVTASSLRQQFAHSVHNIRFLLLYMLTGLATIGIFLSADLFTFYCCFEIMTLSSFAYVANDESSQSRKAAMSYLMYGILGGLVMLFGLLLLYFRFETLNFHALQAMKFQASDKTTLYTACSCLLFGLGAKAGMFPLHTWLPKTYTAAPCAGTTVLSVVLSKTGIYGIFMITYTFFDSDPYWEMTMMILGCLTMFTGGLLGLFSNNIKRTLACSSMSQIGFILAATGCAHSAGALFHTVNHSLFKLILFTVVSILYGMTGELDYNKLAGFANKKWWLKIPFLCAALGISGVPLFSGFLSKSLIHHGIEISMNSHPYASLYHIAEWVFLFSGGMTFAYMLKMYFAIFGNQPHKDSCKEDCCKAKPALLTLVFLFCLSLTTIGIGVYPSTFLPLFTWENMKGILISLSFGALIYLLFVRPLMIKKETTNGKQYNRYLEIFPSWLDIEELIYKPFFLRFLPFWGALFSRLADRLMDGISILVMNTVLRPRGTTHVHNDHPMAFAIGKLADAIFTLVQVKIRKKPAVSRTSYADLFTVGSTEFSRTARLVLYSVSFGLLMFAVGLTVALVYLLTTIH